MERPSGQIHIKEQLKADTEVQPGDYPLAAHKVNVRITKHFLLEAIK